MKALVIGAEGPLESKLARLLPETIRKSTANGDEIDLSAWDKSAENFPILPQPREIATLPAIMLSPLAVSARGASKGYWYKNLSRIGDELDAAVNFRLSRLTGRSVNLHLEPDRLYLRANPKHSVVVHTRKTRSGKPVFVIGMMCPMTIRGTPGDLKSAWLLGIGEKNRNGFGCIAYVNG